MERDLIFELGVEEMPSAYMPGALADIKKLAAEDFKEARLGFKGIEVFGTPRRLVLYVEGLSEMQADAMIENKGPKKAIAFDNEGNPTKACQGFARGQGISTEELEVRDINGIEYIFAVKKDQGKPAMCIIPEILQRITGAIVFPKSMRWGYYHTRFARPIRWIMALFGEEIVNIDIENVRSSNITYGHRFLAGEPLIISDTGRYFDALRENYVVLDQEEREAMIWKQILSVAESVGGTPMENEALLEEITYLVEYPHAFFGQFSRQYLDVPPEVLTTSMIEHQRYFPVFDGEGQLMAGFIGVRNGTDYCLDIVRAGNERVLKARLEDALFFWREDTKKPLEEFVSGLSNVLFHDRLGSMMDKVERLKVLACFIGQETGLSNEKDAKRAAYLCKADLLSSMVYEFPELQGIMGRYYAVKSSESSEVSEAIFEHYLPRGAGDELPVTDTGTVLSLAEKIDNLMGCFCIGIKPTGSQDPYALRRQALGIVNIILNKRLDLDLEKILSRSYDTFRSVNPEVSEQDAVNEVIDFVLQRMRGVLLEKGVTYDVIEAVLSSGSANLTDLLNRVDCVQRYKQSGSFDDFMVVFNRSHNLTKKWDSSDVDDAVLVDKSEKELWEKIKTTRKLVDQANAGREYRAALEQIAELRPDVDDFFESVMVMVEDEKQKSARLGLLKSITDMTNLIADFSKIVQ